MVGEDCGSDLFKSDDDDDDVAGHDYVQPTDSSSNDESSDKGARNPACSSRVPAMTRVPQEVTTSVVSVLVREDCGSDLFESDDDVADHNYVQPSQFSNSNDFRWSLELLHTAIREHRWDDALRFLPCIITHTAPHLPLEFLLEVTDIITRNVPSLSVDDRKKFRSILHGMKLETSVFHDILSQDLAEATDRDADGLMQMIEDIQNQRQPPAQGIETRTDKRFKALSDGYIGLVHYHRWKSSLLNATAASLPLDDDFCSVSICGSQGTGNTDKKEIVRTAHSFLKKAFNGLNESCDWFMLQFLELEKELYGQESAISVLERYKSDPCHAPVHHLAYHFYKNLVPGSVMEQLMELEHISRACPKDPLVLEQVNLYLDSLEHGGPAQERAMMRMRSAESDTGQESSDECPPGPANASCTLKTTGKVEVLMRCLMLLVAMLDYSTYTWDLQPWQKLTQVLTKFYQAWVRCWSCLACRNTRNRIHRLSMMVVPLWKHFVWKEPPATLPLEQARVLFHHVFAAFIFNYSEEYVSHSLSVLQESGHLQLREELMSLINFPGAFLGHFSLLAKKRRKKVEGISLRSLNRAASQYKKAIQQRQKRAQNTSKAATITSFKDIDQETQKDGPFDSEKDFCDHTESNDKVDGKRGSIEGNKDKGRGKQNEVQEKAKSVEQQCDETDIEKQMESTQEERESEEQVLNIIGQGKQEEATSESLEIDVGSVFNQDDSQSSLDILTAGQRERFCDSSPDESAPVSQSGQGFFLTQTRETDEFLLSPDNKEPGSPEHADIKEISQDELKELDLGDLGRYLVVKLVELHYSEFFKNEQNSSELHNWHSDETLDRLLESMSVYQGPEESSIATTEEEKGRQRHGQSGTCSSVTVTRKKTRGTTRRSRVAHYPASWFEGFSLPAIGNNTASKRKDTDGHQTRFKIPAVLPSAPVTKKTSRRSKKVLGDSENVLKNNNHHSVGADSQYATQAASLMSCDRNDTTNLKTKKQCSKRRRISFRVPVMDWIKDVPLTYENRQSKTEALERDITPVPSGTCSSVTVTQKNTRDTTRRSRVAHYPASWFEGLPLPAFGNNTASKSKDTDGHQTRFKIAEAVLPSAPVTKKTSRKSKVLGDSENVLKNNNHHSVGADSQYATQADWLKDLSLPEVSGETVSLMSCDRNDTSNLKKKKQWIKDLPLTHENRQSKTEALERDVTPVPSGTCSSVTVTRKNTRGTTRRSWVAHYPASWFEGLPLPAIGSNTASKSKDTDGHQTRFKIPAVLPSAPVTKKTSRKTKVLGDAENVLKNNNHHSVGADSWYATQADFLKDLPLPEVSGETVSLMSCDRNDTSNLKTKKQCSKKRRVSLRVPVMDWIKDVPLTYENRQFKTEALLERDIKPVPKTKDPTLTISKHQFKSERQKTLMKWTEGLPFDTEKILAGLQKSLHEDNTS
ncbi:uncharacterized protein LOC135091623 isoform X2 [Scylla paramamosain]|uniref:uncharacterized protein LOC135091623 isoform X2 n=1 Tax=Scylla paramamosain TaxID=85552 RepID=UPI003082E612